MEKKRCGKGGEITRNIMNIAFRCIHTVIEKKSMCTKTCLSHPQNFLENTATTVTIPEPSSGFLSSPFHQVCSPFLPPFSSSPVLPGPRARRSPGRLDPTGRVVRRGATFRCTSKTPTPSMRVSNLGRRHDGDGGGRDDGGDRGVRVKASLGRPAVARPEEGLNKNNTRHPEVSMEFH